KDLSELRHVDERLELLALDRGQRALRVPLEQRVHAVCQALRERGEPWDGGTGKRQDEGLLGGAHGHILPRRARAGHEFPSCSPGAGSAFPLPLGPSARDQLPQRLEMRALRYARSPVTCSIL